MAALTELVRQGKARYIGFSEWTPDQIRAALALPGVARFVSSQPHYSMLARAPEAAVLPLCADEGIGTIVFSPLAQGILTGKYQPGSPPPEGSRAADPTVGHWMAHWRRDDVLAAVQRLVPLAREAGLSLAQLALAWVLRGTVTSAIIGASRPEQVHENATASGVVLDADLLVAIDGILAEVVA
jgi:aryl-alcohol dehydrogenase-like predicted oxidoreductase